MIGYKKSSFRMTASITGLCVIISGISSEAAALSIMVLIHIQMFLKSSEGWATK